MLLLLSKNIEIAFLHKGISCLLAELNQELNQSCKT